MGKDLEDDPGKYVKMILGEEWKEEDAIGSRWKRKNGGKIGKDCEVYWTPRPGDSCNRFRMCMYECMWVQGTSQKINDKRIVPGFMKLNKRTQF